MMPLSHICSFKNINQLKRSMRTRTLQMPSCHARRRKVIPHRPALVVDQIFLAIPPIATTEPNLSRMIKLVPAKAALNKRQPSQYSQKKKDTVVFGTINYGFNTIFILGQFERGVFSRQSQDLIPNGQRLRKGFIPIFPK